MCNLNLAVNLRTKVKPKLEIWDVFLLFPSVPDTSCCSGLIFIVIRNLRLIQLKLEKRKYNV